MPRSVLGKFGLDAGKTLQTYALKPFVTGPRRKPLMAHGLSRSIHDLPPTILATARDGHDHAKHSWWGIDELAMGRYLVA